MGAQGSLFRRAAEWAINVCMPVARPPAAQYQNLRAYLRGALVDLSKRSPPLCRRGADDEFSIAVESSERVALRSIAQPPMSSSAEAASLACRCGVATDV